MAASVAWRDGSVLHTELGVTYVIGYYLSLATWLPVLQYSTLYATMMSNATSRVLNGQLKSDCRIRTLWLIQPTAFISKNEPDKKVPNDIAPTEEDYGDMRSPDVGCQ
jgi:hypothetical protein